MVGCAGLGVNVGWGFGVKVGMAGLGVRGMGVPGEGRGGCVCSGGTTSNVC